MKRFLAFVAGIMLLSGCIGGYSPMSKFYTLVGETDITPVSETKISVGVLPVQIPDYLNRPQIILNGVGNQMDLSETNRWIDSLTDLAQSALIFDLQQALPKAFVKTKGYDNAKYNRLVQVEVAQMDGKINGTALLSVWWHVQNMNGRELYRTRFEATAPAGDSYETYAQAQSELWKRLAVEIASYLAGK